MCLIWICTRVCFTSDESCILPLLECYHATNNLFVYVCMRAWKKLSFVHMLVLLYLDCSCVICDGSKLDILHLDVRGKGGALNGCGPTIS